MDYRKATADDLAAICAMVRSAVAAMEARGVFQWDSLYPTEYDFRADADAGTLFVGERGGALCAVCAVNKDCDAQYKNGAWKYPACEWLIIHRLYVSPALQGRGIATRTFAHIESTLRKAGVEAVRLDVFSENPAALALYRHSGYETVSTADWRKGRFFLLEKKL